MEDVDSALRIWRLARDLEGRGPTAVSDEQVRETLIDPATILVLVDRADQPVGMGVAEPFRDDDGLGELRPGWGHVTMVFVDPAHQGAGVGSEVLQRLAATVPWKSLSLWTQESNLRAHGLYQRSGFRVTDDLGKLPDGEAIRRWERLAE